MKYRHHDCIINVYLCKDEKVLMKHDMLSHGHSVRDYECFFVILVYIFFPFLSLVSGLWTTQRIFQDAGSSSLPMPPEFFIGSESGSVFDAFP